MKSSYLIELGRYLGGPGILYHYYKTGRFPNVISISDYDSVGWEKIYRYCRNTYHWEEGDEIEKEYISADGKKKTYLFLHLKGSITLCNPYDRKAKLLYDTTTDPKLLEEIQERFYRIAPQISPHSIGIIRQASGRLEVKSFNFNPPEQSIIRYLDEATQELYHRMIRELQQSNGSGLYLLHGEPGTGKTTFIKEVLSETDKKALFLSPSLTEDLTSPNLISLLMDYPDSILVIEDAESVIMERQADNSNAVSNLLNMTDGFLADFLNLKIICTFNTELRNIDKALCRNGRLKGMHEFTKLEPGRAKDVAELLGREIYPEKPMTIAEICNSGEFAGEYQSKSIGFAK
ncbi:MAG: AAA family ATPase [Balneolaceae bacterium]|nr:AAA family ATPase [Balneolaceae bacterium]